MPPAYELAVLGRPTTTQVTELEEAVATIVGRFGLRLHEEVAWLVQPHEFFPNQRRAAAAVFFGGEGVEIGAASALPEQAIPAIPVVTDLRRTALELPTQLQGLNALAYPDEGVIRIATALLECAGLLPRQRRVFVSYRREEARAAALQLFDAISGRVYDVFLDTHGVAPGDDFQDILWHRLCESDVLVMLDTPGYFESRWTAAEFGRALAKGISVLSVGWPDCTPSPRTATATRVELTQEDLDPTRGMLSDAALQRICSHLELVRSESIAVRRLNLVSKIAYDLKRIGGRVSAIGAGTGMHVLLPGGQQLIVYPAVGVPTSMTLHQARLHSPTEDVAVAYDHIGLSDDWLRHLAWLGSQIRNPRWVRAEGAGWAFADWEARK